MSADSPQAEINPYASPGAIPAGAEEAMPAEVLFGLERPICAAGMLSRKDIRQAMRIATGITPKGLVAAILPAGGLGFFAWEFALPALLIPAAIIFAMYALIWLIYCLSISSNVQDGCRERTELFFGETEAQSVSPSLETTGDWRLYNKCTCTDTHVLLHFYVGDYAVIPRSFFTCDSDWLQLVALVKHKLPEKKARPAPEPDTNASPPIEGEEGEGAIHGQLRLTYRDFLTSRKNVVGRWRIRLVQVVALAVAAAPLLAVTLIGPGPGPMELVLMLGAVALVGWIVCITPWRGVRRVARLHQGLFAVSAIAVSEEGVAQKQHLSRLKFRWSYFVGKRLLQDHILLYLPSHSRVHIVPRSSFSEADWPAVVALVERKLPRV